MRVTIQVMGNGWSNKNGGTYREDIQIRTIKFRYLWCHGTSDIKDMGVTERWTLMPRVIIDTF